MSKKLISVAIGAATLVALVGPTFANAQSTADLQAQIAALLAQIQTLQSKLGTSGSTSGSYNFTSDLTVGSKGADVSALQQVLINGGYLTAVTAPTGYFGAATKAAVAKWQAAVGLSPAAGYFGPKSRAYLNSSAPVGGGTGGSTGGTGGGVVAPASGVAVALASDNPASGSLVNGSGRNPVMAFTLTAGNSGAATVNQLKFTKTGVVSDSTISGAYLVQGGKVVAQYVSLASGVITFSNLNISLAAGQSQEFWLAVDVSGGSAGNTVSFKVNAATDVSATDASNNALTASGMFPINGGTYTVSTVSTPGLASLTITSSTVGGTVFAGTQNVLVSQWTPNVTNSSVWLKSIKFRVTGSANKSDLQNVKLYINGAQVGSTLSSVSANGDAYFDLSANPAKLTTGNSNMQVYADVMGSPSYTFQFQLLNSFDVYAVDSQYNTSLAVTVNGGAGSLVTIQQGQLTVSLASDSPTGNIGKGQSAITIAKFKIYAAGEAVKVKFLDFTLTEASTTSGQTPSTDFKNIALIDDQGGQVGTTINTPGAGTTSCASGTTEWTNAGGAASVYRNCFGTSASPINYIIPANTTRVLSLVADIQTGAGFTTITGALAGNTANLQGLTSSQTANTGGVTGSSRTLSASALTVSQNAAVGTQTFTGNTQGARIGSYTLAASSADGVSISNISINTGGNANTNYTNLRVNAGGVAFGQAYSSLSASTTYSFSGTPFTVPAGQQVTVDVYADILSGAASAGAASTLSSCTGTGVVSRSSVSCTSTTGQTVTINTTGPTLTVSADTGTAPQGQLVMGVGGNSLASFRFAETSNVEDVKITALNVFEKTGAPSPTVLSGYGNVALWDGTNSYQYTSVSASAATSTAGGYYVGYNYVFNFPSGIVVPKSGSKTLVLKGDVATYPSGGATDNSTTTFVIATSTEITASSSVITARGAYSNIPAVNVFSSPNGNTMTILRTKLTLAGVTVSSGQSALQACGNTGTLPANFTQGSLARALSATDVVGCLQLNAATGADVTLNTLTLKLVGAAVVSTTISLIDPGTGTNWSGTGAVACNTGGTTSCTSQFAFTTAPVITQGTSKVVAVRVDSSGFTQGTQGTLKGAQVLVNANTDVTWSDPSTTNLNVEATAVPLTFVNVGY